MASITAHGLCWKDTHPGVWTAMTQTGDIPMIVYAVEVELADRDVKAATKEGERYLEMAREECNWDGYPRTRFLNGGKPHVIIAFLR